MARLHRLSTEEIMRVARERFSLISSQQHIEISTIQMFFSSSQLDLSDGEIKDVELVLILIASAHQVSDKNINDARRLLNLCDFLSSLRGNPVQRVVHYFSKALQERISREIEIISGSESDEIKLSHPYQPDAGPSPALISCCIQLPCLQVAQFVGMQAVVDTLASAKKLHFIDLAIRSGGHCAALMQTLANQQECPIELLKITAVGISEKKQKLEETGKCLTSFARTINIPFLFTTAVVEHITDLNEEIFELSDDEVVAVHSACVLRMMEAQPGCLPSVLRVLKNLNPSVLVIVELETNYSSPNFVDQFYESLLFFSAWYDCIEACIDQGDPNRLSVEAWLGNEIKEIVAGKHVESYELMKIDGWRAYFSRFGMEETEVCVSSFDQAELLLKNFASRESCSLVRNGKCVVTDWKGTPLLSVSAWKFQQRLPKKSFIKKSKVC